MDDIFLPLLLSNFEVLPVDILWLVGQADFDGVAIDREKVIVLLVQFQKNVPKGQQTKGNHGLTQKLQRLALLLLRGVSSNLVLHISDFVLQICQLFLVI